MNKQYEQVAEFHKACSIEMPEKPTLLSGAAEEVNKYYATKLNHYCNHMKDDNRDIGGEVLARSSYMLEELTEFMNAETIEDQADALADLIYFALGTYTLMGLKPEQIFNEVQAANMRKVVNGKVLRNEQGKIVKPDGWYGPEAKIKEEIERQTSKRGRDFGTCATCGVKTNGYYDDCSSCIAEGL